MGIFKKKKSYVIINCPACDSYVRITPLDIKYIKDFRPTYRCVNCNSIIYLSEETMKRLR